MADISLNVSLNPASAAVLAALPGDSGADGGSDTQGSFATLLGRQIEQAALSPEAALRPIAKLLGEAEQAEGGAAAIPADLAALLANPAIAAAISLVETSKPAGDGVAGETGLAAAAGRNAGGVIDLMQKAADPAAAALATDDGKITGDAANDAGRSMPVAHAEFAPALRAAANADAVLASKAEPHAQATAGGAILPGNAHHVFSAAQLAAGNATVVQPAAHVEASVGSPAWGHEVGQRMLWMAGRDQGRAELTLTPPNLGKLEVVVTVQNGEANAHFVSAHAPVRDALEQALPRLREIFAQAGLSLGQTSVNAESPQQDPQARPQSYTSSRDAGTSSLVAAPASASWTRHGVGLIDTFA